ncbi:MAG: hydroxyphenylacetyl-CoA thioesterase PaaI [Candidatus Baltobacteraceae bacterium]|jgi:acyl-CoA thioesterase
MNDGTAEAELAGRVSAAMYAKDRAAQMLGIQLRTVRHGYAELTMTVREDMLNVHGLCHGGLVFALADTAFGYACHTRNQANVALQGAISFTAPARLGDELIAVAEQRAQGGRTGTYDVTIGLADGTVLALFRGTNYRVNGTVL